MKDIRVENIVSKGWENVTEEDLKFLYFEKDMIKKEIANLFHVSFNQVRYKLKKFDLNWQRNVIAEGMKEVLHDIKKEALRKLIFTDELHDGNYENDALDWGPVKVLQGKYQGRIGYLHEEEGAYGYVYWGEMVLSRDSYAKIKLEYLSNDISTYDLATRAEELRTQIARMRAIRDREENEELYKEITELFGEYSYIVGLLNRIYEETVHQNNGNKKRVFLSYSSLNKTEATWIATDLKRAGYQVWFDVWEIEGGHNIIDEIGKGLETANALVMLVSKSYTNSVMCKTEWNSYFMTKFKDQPNSIIPIVLDDTVPPIILSSIRYLKLSDGYDSMIGDLKRALTKL